jgi:ribonuclease HIII
MSHNTASIENKLRNCELAIASNEEKSLRLCNEIYKVVFREKNELAFWDEKVLLALERVFRIFPPDVETYGKVVQELLDRTHKVSNINDIFFKFLDKSISLNNVIDELSDFVKLREDVKQRLRSCDNLVELRKTPISPSDKLQNFMDCVLGIMPTDSGPRFDEFNYCIQAIKDREEIGKANILLVNKQGDQGILLTVTAKVQRGSGQIKILTPAASTYVSAVERARLALVGKSYIPESQDVILSAEMTEAEYSGGSIALGASMAIYSSACKCYLDPYTAFTGDINLQENDFIIKRVEGIQQKLQAAKEAGCRRIFIPLDNKPDVESEYSKQLKIVFVKDITEVLVNLFHNVNNALSDTLESRKINLLQLRCVDQGWHISDPRAIQDGLQFVISPPSPPELKVNIYKSGAHTPKRHDRPDFQRLLDELNTIDNPPVPLQSINKVIIIKDSELRGKICDSLNKISPTEVKNEQYCDYSFRFVEGKENILVKQFTSGKLLLQGYGGPSYKLILEAIIPNYNLRYPNAELKIEDYLSKTNTPMNVGKKKVAPVTEEVIQMPYIGTDESGKGDYFGPLIVAAVWLDEPTKNLLEKLGVRDSKTLSDKKCQELAVKIRDLCRGKYKEVEILPERYNSLYNQLRSEGKNLNHLLAWGHARALETLLAQNSSQYAVADQFGDESYIKSKLMEKGRSVRLVQTPKAERYTAVAAASILARDRFLFRLQQASQQFGINFPKGASPAVVDAARSIVKRDGLAVLQNVAKMHFKTTSVVMGT